MERSHPKKRLTREEAKAQTRQALLDAAGAVFAEKGFHGASIDMVAEEAGYTKGAVYAHFSSKEDLYLALLDAHLQSADPPWIAKIESGVPIAEIAPFIEEKLPETIEETRSWAMLTLEFFLHAMRDESLRERLAQRFVRALDDYEASITKRVQSGRDIPKALNPRQLAIILMAFENGMSIMGLTDPMTLSGGTYSAAISQLLGE